MQVEHAAGGVRDTTTHYVHAIRSTQQCMTGKTMRALLLRMSFIPS